MRAVLAALALCACVKPPPPSGPSPISLAPPPPPARWVDPFIGTDDSTSPTPVPLGAGGATYPGAAAPFGMVQWSPDTPTAQPDGYRYSDERILGFSLTHLNGAGCASMRDFPVVPLVGDFDPTSDEAMPFRHENEHAWPGFYEVTLDNGVTVDLTATQRTGLARFTFPEGADPRLAIGAGRSWDIIVVRGFELKVAGPDLIVGSRASGFCSAFIAGTLHIAARFDRPIASVAGWSTGTGSRLAEGEDEVAGFPAGLVLGFDGGRIVHMKVGLSYVSAEKALANLEAENPGWDFEAVRRGTVERWNEYLGRVEVEGGTEDDRTSFYTALYRTFLQPAVFSDVDGEFVGFDRKVHRAEGHVRYANFSGWDVYRSWIQLVSVLAPKETGDMIRSLVASGRECGALPRWAILHEEAAVMPGDPADVMIASAHAFGVRGFDEREALSLMLRGADDPAARCNGWTARPGLRSYLSLGFLPSDRDEGVWGPPSTTLEYAVADFSVARFAAALEDAPLAARFDERSRNWRNVFDSGKEQYGFSGYVQPRLAADRDGEPQFSRTDVGLHGGFTEGNAAQYTFMVPHDAYGLIDALGGDEAALARLDFLFQEVNAGIDRPHFYMGNEPQFGTPWLYPFAGAPARTQSVVRRILREAYSTGPGGLPGNEDLGATSSWQAWAMMGIYPAIPGIAGFVLGSPIFPRITIRRPGAAPLVIEADGAPDALHVREVRLNGGEWKRSWIPWDAVSAGGSLQFQLGDSPSADFGTAREHRPPAILP